MKNFSTTAAHEPVTSLTPNAWAVGRGDEAQSTTFRALAWSQEDDIVSEPLPYTGEPYEEHQEHTVEAVEPSPAGLQRRSTRLYGIAAGLVAAAIGGLLITVVNTEDGPVTISTKVTQPATNVVNSLPHTQTVPIQPSSPAPVKTAAATARVVSSTVAPTRAFAAPAPELQTSPTPESAAPDAAVPAAAVPAAAAPEAAAPEAAAPEAAAPAPAAAKPEFTPPGAKPPVWVPPVTPQNVPHPVGSHTFDVPDLDLPTGTDFGILAPAGPASPAASNPVLTLKPGVIIPTVIPTLLPGTGQ